MKKRQDENDSISRKTCAAVSLVTKPDSKRSPEIKNTSASMRLAAWIIEQKALRSPVRRFSASAGSDKENGASKCTSAVWKIFSMGRSFLAFLGCFLGSTPRFALLCRKELCCVDMGVRCVTEPSLRFTVTFGSSCTVIFDSSCTVIFDQVGKASLRIEFLCQHNMDRANFYRHDMDRAKLNSDHRNSNFAAMLAAGATIGIRISREHSP